MLRTMGMLGVLSLGLGLLATPAAAQDCTTLATIGQFEVEFDGAVFDGSSTKFTYCVTGLDDPALSNWMLTLDVECIGESDITDCGPDPCYYQEDDPNLEITGIKWDDVEVNPGETKCYDFSLDGDWTSPLGEVTVGLKAGQGVHYGDVCGPTCVGCEASLEVIGAGSGQPSYRLRIEHNRPPTVATEVRYTLYKESGRRIRRWRSERFELVQGGIYESSGPIPLRRDLAPGVYKLEVKVKGMSRWHTRETEFRVRE